MIFILGGGVKESSARDLIFGYEGTVADKVNKGAML